MHEELNILIVDDDRLIRTAVGRTIRKNEDENIKYNIIEADCSRKMFDILESDDIDCIILDYVLVDSDGMTILQELSRRKYDTPVIMMTGQGDEMIAVNCLKAGAYDYLPKSILTHNNSSEILVYTVLNTLDKYNAKKERQSTSIALRKSEERYRSLVENSPMLIMRFFPDDKKISFVNNSLCRYFNLAKFDLIGDTIYKYVFNNNADEIENIIASLSKDNPVQNYNHESEINGNRQWQMWTFQGLSDAHGEIHEYQCIGEDITPLKKVEGEYYKQKVYFQSILDSQENMIIVTDRKEIIEANHSFLIFFGYRSLEDFRKEHTDIIELAKYVDAPGYITGKEGVHWIDYITGSKQKHTQYLMTFNNSPKIFSIHINILSLETEAYVVTFSDVTQLEMKSQSFEEKASIDALTGIYNRDKFNELLQANIEMAKRYDTYLSLIFFDIDHFKKINDTHGHQAGDNVLRELADLIMKAKRKSDFFARWGGEEFVILLPHTNMENALRVANKYRKMIMKHKFPGIGSLTCSFGVTIISEKDTVDKYISRADKALYKAKESGRNRVAGIKAE